MSRWSIGNLVMPVSREQFIDLTAQFRTAAETSFGGSCRLEIRAMDEVKETSSVIHDDWVMEAIALANRSRTFFETDDPAKLTGDIWKRSAYVEVSVRPVDEKSAPQSAWGHAEFKGHLPHQATFYLQPDDNGARDAMIAQNRGKLIGDGFTSNTDAGVTMLRRFVS